MERIALFNKKGMSLIEVMISLVILMFVSLAVMKTALVGMSANLQNSMRDEAVNVVDQRMNELRSLATGTSFDNSSDLVPSTVSEPTVTHQLRGAIIAYAPTRTVSSINGDTKQVTLSVVWTYRGTSYTHSVTTIMRRQ
jgi:prepilin-type N-terminal cleavage/methylation domain-containing protein